MVTINLQVGLLRTIDLSKVVDVLVLTTSTINRLVFVDVIETLQPCMEEHYRTTSFRAIVLDDALVV